MIRYNEPLQVHPIEVLPHIHPLAYQLHNVLLADMDKTSDQQKIQDKAHHLIIQHKEDNQGSRLQINMVSDPPPISLAGEQIRIPLLTDMGNTNVQPEIRAKAYHLIILHKEDNQDNHLQINMVSVLRQINQIRRTGGSNHIHPLATPMIDTDNINPDDRYGQYQRPMQEGNQRPSAQQSVNTSDRNASAYSPSRSTAEQRPVDRNGQYQPSTLESRPRSITQPNGLM